MMTRTLALWALTAALLAGAMAMAHAQPDPRDEYIIVSGGPSLLEWEQFRREEQRHDRWWGNFVRTARIRIDQLKKYYKDKGDINITWLVHRPGYESRAGEDGQPLIANIESVRDKYGVRLIWFSEGSEVINYLNEGQNRRQLKVGGFEYFGHSNKYCWTFDYSNEILGASRSFLHERDLKNIRRGVFSRDAFCKSWGCHSGESFVKAFKKATGVEMIGAVGKTDYSKTYQLILPFLSSPGGRWTK
jgi:hypothetical protein